MSNQFAKEYKSYSAGQLKEIAGCKTGEYRKEAVESAIAELASRGETGMTADENDSPLEEKRESRGRRDFAIVSYLLCWVLAVCSLFELGRFLIAVPPGSVSVLKNGEFLIRIFVLLILFASVWRFHILLFGKPPLGKGSDPLSRFLTRIDRSIPPKISGERGRRLR